MVYIYLYKSRVNLLYVQSEILTSFCPYTKMWTPDSWISDNLSVVLQYPKTPFRVHVNHFSVQKLTSVNSFSLIKNFTTTSIRQNKSLY